MRLFGSLAVGLLVAATGVFSTPTEGIYNLVKRRLPEHVDSFEFSLVDDGGSDSNVPLNAEFVVTASGGKVRIEGNSLSALSSGYILITFMRFIQLLMFDLFSLHKYLTEVVHVDIHWFIGSRLDQAPPELPALEQPLKGSSVVPWRYHFNTGTNI